LSEPIQLIEGVACFDYFREESRAEVVRRHGPEGLVSWLRASWDPADYLDPSLPPLAERDAPVRSAATEGDVKMPSSSPIK